MTEDRGSPHAQWRDLRSSSFFALFVVDFSSLTRIDQKRLRRGSPRRCQLSSRHLSRHPSRSSLSLNLNLSSSSRSSLSPNLNLSPRSRLSLNLDLGPRPSHRPSRASCPLMNFSAFLSWTRPRQRLSCANVTADSARLTSIARVVASRINRSFLILSMETSLFEISGLSDCVMRMERVPNRCNPFLSPWVKNSSRFIFLIRDFDLGQEFTWREFELLANHDQIHVHYPFKSPEVR